MTATVQQFWQRLKEFSREELLDIIDQQDPELTLEIKRIEWVFEKKLRHLTWADGSQITERPLSNEELALLVDPPFNVDPDLTKMGLSVEQQRQVWIAADPVLWAKHFLGVRPRAYQILMLRYPKNRKVLRAGRRLGKTFTMAVKMLHYSYTHNHGRTLVLTPMKSQADVIFKELNKLIELNGIVKQSISRAVTSPWHVLEFKNGSSIKFFSTGMKSGGRSDVARGQEAHLIVLDELDYMGPEDLDAIYAMLQKTDKDQPDKELIGASTPTGRREKFWDWCTDGVKKGRFKEFWFPSYVNPNFDKAMEDELREEYTEMVYRHEIEADWGEDVEGVYPRRWVDIAFRQYDWEYKSEPQSARSFFVMGVDWDKYGAGPNIAILEVCYDDYEDERFAGKIRMAWREEIPREEYVLTKAVNRIIELNYIFQPRHIYVDRGYGEVQVEMLHKYGVENPDSQLKKRVTGVSFSEMIVMRDPATKQEVKKDVKPFMVDNMRQMFEKEAILFPDSDEHLYLEYIGYVVLRTSVLGRPVFEKGEAGDHAHDATILACLAITQNYGDLMKLKLARRGYTISNDVFLPQFEVDSAREEKIVEDVYGSVGNAPVRLKRAGSFRRAGSSRPFKRNSF